MDLCSSPLLLSCTLLLQPVVAEHDISWQIASDISGQSTPNILSELDYHGIRSTGAGLGLVLDYQFAENSPWQLGLMLGIQGSDISDGNYSDSDYSGDNRTGLFSRSVGQINNGGFRQLSGELGLYRQLDARHQLGVVGSLEQSEIDLVMTDGVQVVPDTGAITGLNSSYDSQWQSGSLGLEYRYRMLQWGTFSLRYSRFIGDFEAEANWNLRADFKHPTSFIHHADSQGDAIRLGYRSTHTGTFGWRFDYQWRELNTDPGLDRTFLSNNSIVDTRLNEVEWQNQSITLGLEWRL